MVRFRAWNNLKTRTAHLARAAANGETSSRQLPKDLQGIIDCVRRYGFAMAGNFWPDRTTMDVGRSIGVVMDPPALRPGVV